VIAKERLNLRRALIDLEQFDHHDTELLNDAESLIYEKAHFMSNVLPVLAYEGAECIAYCPDALISAAKIARQIIATQSIDMNAWLL